MKILVSACILGKNCKYNGGNNYNHKVLEYLKGREVIEICPEVMAGLSTPRACAEMRDGRIIDADGNDVDNQYREAVQTAMEKIKGMDINFAILQSRSPTCGVNQIYDGSFLGKLIEGRGLFAQALLEQGYRVIDAEDIK